MFRLLLAGFQHTAPRDDWQVQTHTHTHATSPKRQDFTSHLCAGAAGVGIKAKSLKQKLCFGA